MVRKCAYEARVPRVVLTHTIPTAAAPGVPLESGRRYT